MSRQIQLTAAKCRECIKFGKNIKSVLLLGNGVPSDVLKKKPNQEIQLDFLGPLLAIWGANIFILICVDRFSKFQPLLPEPRLRLLGASLKTTLC